MKATDAQFTNPVSQEHKQLKTPYERLLTPREVGNWLGVSDRWVRDHSTRRMPRIKAIKLGSLLRFRCLDVQEFLADQSERAVLKCLRHK